VLSVERILTARRSIDPVFRDSAQYQSDRLGHEPSANVLLKIESLNPIGSFKGRGASWWLQCQQGTERVVCASAGNFGQGIAHAARAAVEVDVFAAENANPSKIRAMERLGATVHLHGLDFDEAKARALEFATKGGHCYVEDGLEDEIAEGAGTIAVELLEHADPIDVVYVPVGNGALINGVGAFFKQRSPQTRIVGVCAQGAPSMERSWRRSDLVETPIVETIADGVAARVPIQRALDLMAEVVDDMMLVDDQQIVEAMRRLFERENLVVEPAGAVSLAGSLADPGRRPEETLAVIVTGSNIDPQRRHEWLLGD
jgi:threonine dehydratase